MSKLGRLKDVLTLSSMIAATGLTGGTALALAPVIGFGAKFLPDNKDSDAEKIWKLSHIDAWMELSRRLMDRWMPNALKARTLKNKIRADYFRRYAEMPKTRWVDRLHSDIVLAVKGDMAAEFPDA